MIDEVWNQPKRIDEIEEIDGIDKINEIDKIDNLVKLCIIDENHKIDEIQN